MMRCHPCRRALTGPLGLCRLNREVAKLDSFKKNLIQHLQEDDEVVGHACRAGGGAVAYCVAMGTGEGMELRLRMCPCCAAQQDGHGGPVLRAVSGGRAEQRTQVRRGSIGRAHHHDVPSAPFRCVWRCV